MLGNSKSKISPKTISLSFGILVLLFSLSFIAFAWTEPTLLPPSGNADSPLNVGTTAQTKNARLSVTELYDANDSTYYLNPNGQSVLSGPLGIGTTGPNEKLDVAGSIISRGGPLTRMSGNILYYADQRWTVSTSGTISSVGNAFKPGDSYAAITDVTLPIVVTIENTAGWPCGTICGALKPYIQAHGALTATIQTELKTTAGAWVTIYGPTAITFSAGEFKFLGSTGSITYPTDFPVKGIRFTISGFTGTNYIRQFGYYQERMLDSFPFPTMGGTTFLGLGGNVGIGTTGPNQKLDVAGDMTLQNNGKFGLNNDLSGEVRSIKLRSSYSGDETNAGTIVYRPSWDLNSLGIVGAGTASNRNVRIWDSLTIGYSTPTAGTSLAVSGNVGIGSSSPNTALDLNGALSIRAIAAPSVSPLTQGRIYFDSTANKFKVSENGGAYIDLLSTSGLTGSGSSGQAAFFTGASTLSGDNGFFWDNTNKRLGIGTTVPDFPLHILNNNNLYVEFQNTTPGGYEELYLRGDNGNSQIFHVNSTYAGWGGANSLNLYNSNGPIAFYANSLNSSLFLNAGTGNVGIGTTGPGMKLDILPGAGTETAFRIQSSGGTSDNFYIGQWGGTGSNWNLGGQNAGTMNLYINRNAAAGDVIIGATNGGANSRVLMIQGSTGNVGIGTTGPRWKLDVLTDTFFANLEAITGTNSISWRFSNTGGQLFVGLDNSTGSSFSTGTAYAGAIWRSGNNPISFVTNYNERMRIDGSGNVGIGTTTPGSKLEVVGDIISKGTSWTSRASAADNGWSSVAYGNGLFVAVSSSGTGNRVMTSPDGINWTIRTSAADNIWNSVTYGNGLFVAVAQSGTGNRVMTSPDGINWTIRTSAANNDWRSVTYGNGLFVAVSGNGFGVNGVMTSPDGITWTSRTPAADNGWDSVTYGNGLFVAVAVTGTGNRVMTSPDGITWTSRTSAADNDWFSVTYGNGLFVAVSFSGANKVMTSPDGITWTSRTSANNTWRSVTYGNGLFVAVADLSSGAAGVMTSPDGITWTSRTPAASNDWSGVTYGNGLFVAVAQSGTGNRVMTSGKTELNIIPTIASGVPSGYCIFPKPTILTCPSGYTSFTIPLLSHAHNMLEYVSGGGFYYDTASNSSGQQFMCCKD